MKIAFSLAVLFSSFCSTASLHGEGSSGFAGQEQSESTGLSYCRARFYDPETGAFLSKDPSGVVDGPNMYQYSHSNPVNKVDRTGHVAETVWDVVNLGIGLGSLGNNVWNGKWGDAAFDVAGLVYDGVATAIPFLPAGASAALKAGRGAETALTVATTLKKTETAVVKVATEGAGLTAQTFGSRVHKIVETSHLKNWDISVKPGFEGVDFLSPDKSWMMDITTFRNWPQHNKYPEVTDTIVGLLYERQSGVVGVGTGLFEASNTYGRLTAGGGALNLAWDGGWALGGYIKDQSGVLIDKAAELVGSNLADIKGATYDPVSNQIIFLGSNSTPGVEGIDMDYFFTAVQTVYGSAIPPYVSLDAPAAAASLWQDLGDGDGSFEAGEWGGFSMRYNPLWSEEDGTVAVRVKCSIGATNYDFNVNFTPQTISWLEYPNGQKPMHLVYSSITGTAPPGISVWTGPFTTLPFPQTVLDFVNTSSNVNGGQDWTYPFQLYNGGTGTITNISFAVIPDRQHRRFGGRLEGTKLGWVLQEADRIMKCLAIGTDNVTGANYTSATVPIAGYKNLAEINAAGTSVSGNTRVWFLADQMKLFNCVGNC
jgi:RHS repeat-associated protein